MTYPQFLQVMAYLEAGSGTSKPVSKTQVEVYWDMLQGLDYGAAKRAAKLAIAESQYPTIPPVGVLLRLAGASPVSVENRALVAYGAVQHAVQAAGGYQSVDFDDPLANAVIRKMGGWERFCNWLDADLQWRQKAFVEFYEALSQIGVSGGAAAALPGINDRDSGAPPQIRNFTCGLPAPAPGVIRGEIPALSAPSQKRIAAVIEQVADAKAVAAYEARSKAVVAEVEPISEDEFQRRKALFTSQLKHCAQLERSSVSGDQ